MRNGTGCSGQFVWFLFCPSRLRIENDNEHRFMEPSPSLAHAPHHTHTHICKIYSEQNRDTNVNSLSVRSIYAPFMPIMQCKMVKRFRWATNSNTPQIPIQNDRTIFFSEPFTCCMACTTIALQYCTAIAQSNRIRLWSVFGNIVRVYLSLAFLSRIC